MSIRRRRQQTVMWTLAALAALAALAITAAGLAMTFPLIHTPGSFAGRVRAMR